MPTAAYPINTFQPIIPSDGPPTESLQGVLGQIAVDVNSGAYYERIGGRWFALGSGPTNPELTTLTGNASVDGSPADGATHNNVTFTALDQEGAPMAVPLSITLDSGTAFTDTQTITTNSSTGTATVSLTDTVAEAVTVTATSGATTATATSTFT